LFKKIICTENEDDDYEYIANDNGIKPNISNASSTISIKTNSSSGITSKDKKVSNFLF
jgi:hypothetical protein